MRKRIEDIYKSLLSSEVIQDSQGIVGLDLRESVRWLANNRNNTTTEGINNYDVQGDDDVDNYTVTN